MINTSVRSQDIQTRAHHYLQHALGSTNARFRPDQLEAIQQLVEAQARLFVVQRTGWGKSIVYFLACRLLRDLGRGPALLVSPLLALMRNQIHMAENIGIRAYTINSTNPDDWESVREALRNDQVDILLISPERLANSVFLENVLTDVASRIGLFIVDEAHCISDWGHDFRPDYRRISRILQRLPKSIPVIATTATANDRVVRDVQVQIGELLQVIRGPIKRESLQLQNIQLPTQAERLAWLSKTIPHLPGSGIIYTLTVADSHRVADWLQHRGINARAYSGQLESDRRIELEQQLLFNEVKALVATSALGMGFDKPDLGFVIHFQRPASAIHYYQQIGRAGRALDDAYAILLSGREDDDIIDYFTQTAFPTESDVRRILDVLEDAPDGMTATEIQRSINMRPRRIEHTLKILATEFPAPVVFEQRKWFRTPITYTLDTDRIRYITQLREHEKWQMRQYMESQSCLMAFLESELGVEQPKPCGRCAPCRGRLIVPTQIDSGEVAKANQFLRSGSYEITPRVQWPAPGIEKYNMHGRIPPHLKHEPGRALSIWRDAGWGTSVADGKFRDNEFSQELVEAASRLIRNEWKPDPFPTWVACVPSLQRPDLVPEFARRLADALDIPFRPCVKKKRDTPPQKEMENSIQQLSNIAGSFSIDRRLVLPGPVLLVDDIVDSRWTMTLIAAQLRRSGASNVFPFALAKMFAG